MSKIAYDLKKIRAVVFDVDGVLSPATVPMTAEGVPQRMANLRDGYAMQLAVKKGLSLCIITGANVESIGVRYRALGIKDIYIGAGHKLPILQQWMEANGFTSEEVAYVGDDIPDIPAMQYVGLAVSPRDGATEVKQVASFISTVDGGYGVARELIEEILKAQGLWMETSSAFGW